MINSDVEAPSEIVVSIQSTDNAPNENSLRGRKKRGRSKESSVSVECVFV